MIARTLFLCLGLFCFAEAPAAACPPAADGQVDIYPTAKILPENLLRLYVYFPRAMALDEGRRSVRLLDDKGAAVEGVFLANREELWSPDRRRLTLLFDPGRVKTGLAAHEALGRALIPGRSYTLEVSGAAMDRDRCPLGADTRYSFVVGPADLETPDPAAWSLTTPKASSAQPLIVRLVGAHDHLSLAFRLRVQNAEGAVVPGSIALGDGEQSWRFTPRAPWSAEPYYLVIDKRLEDVAGNRPGALFDRPAHQPLRPYVDRLQFTPRR